MELERPIDSAHLLAPYQTAVQEAESQNQPLELGNHLVNLGLVQFSVQDYKNGIDNLDQAVLIAQKEKDAATEAVFLGKKGLAIWEAGQYPTALECFRDVLKIAEANNFLALQCDALGNIGMLMLDTGDPNQSVLNLKEALTIANSLEDKNRMIIHWGGLGNAYLEVSNIEHAVQCFNEALELAREIGDQQAEAGYLNNLGIVYTQQNDAKKSIRYFQQGLNLIKQLGDKDAELNVIRFLIQAYQKQNQLEKLVQHLDRAISITEDIDKREDRNEFIELLIPVLIYQQKYQDAIVAINKLLPDIDNEADISKKMSQLINVGQCYTEVQKNKKATKAYEAAFDISVRTADEKSEAFILGRLATVQAEQGFLKTSNETIKKSLKIAEKLNNFTLVSELYCIQAMNFRDLLQNPSAIEACNQAISVLNKDQDPDTYSTAVELLAEINSIS
jgi:tetratricopeptide (TPR) repeat protein